MKKNKMMRLASAMMVTTLMTTSVISGTFAKYVTSDEAEDSARVAKWGVTVAATGSLYGTKYSADDNKITAVDDTTTVSVYGKQSTGVNKVVAPGTMSDKGFHFSVNGTPEVDAIMEVEITHQNIFLGEGEYGVMIAVDDVTQDNYIDDYYYTKVGTTYTLVKDWSDSLATGWYELHDEASVASTGYWPVVYTMTGDTSYDAGGDVSGDSLKKIADLVAGQVDGAPTVKDTDKASLYTYTGSKAIEQNTNIATELKLNNIVLSWAWSFDHGTGAYDAADTILGNLMAERIDVEKGGSDFKGEVVKLDGTSYVAPTEGKDFCLDTNFSVEIKVTQVD